MPALFPHSDDLLQLGLFLGCGALGALIAYVCKEGRLQLPRLVVEHEEDGTTKRFLDPGFFGTTLLGALVAAWFDGRPLTALFAGATAGYVGRDILKPLIQKWLDDKFAGTPLTATLSPRPPERALPPAPPGA